MQSLSLITSVLVAGVVVGCSSEKAPPVTPVAWNQST
jgi:hypothetical protein